MKRLFYSAVCLIIFYTLLSVSSLAETITKPGKGETAGRTSQYHIQHATIGKIRWWSNPDYTRIAIELDRNAAWSAHKLGDGGVGKPGRIYLDIKDAKLGAGVTDTAIGDGLLKGVRVSQYRSDVARVVLDTLNIKDYKVFALADPARIVIDVRGERPAAISKLDESVTSLQKPQHKERQAALRSDPEKVKTSRQQAISRIRRIVVDPGHGGHDPGAVGPSGVQEKDVVLSVGLLLKEYLEDGLGLDVVMTRSTDIFLPLEERTAIANKVGADLFVSIHANASLNRNAAGIETYYLNLAKTDKAAQLAAKENGTSLENVTLLQAVLFDLMANYKLNDSAHLSEEVQKSLYHKMHARFSDIKNLGVKQGPFYVLVGATMPSILVETAFVSNSIEESRLKEAEYQKMIAEGIMEGVRGYISSLQ